MGYIRYLYPLERLLVVNIMTCHPKMHYIFRYLIGVVALLQMGWAQTGVGDADRESELQTLQSEITKYEKQLSEQKAKEQSTSNLIASLDRQIDVTRDLLYDLRTEIRQAEQRIQQSAQQVEQLQEQIAELKEIIKKRLVSFYKYGRRHDYALLLSGDSWQRVNVWLKYQKMVAQNDRRNYDALVEKKEQLETERTTLEQQKNQKERALAERQRRAQALQASRSKRASYLQTLKNDTQFIQQHLQELVDAQEQIKRFITQSEKARVDKQRQISHKRDQVIRKPTRDYSFASRKGRLPWPTDGDVITHFGTYRHPILRTVTENLGIEIQAPLGSNVRVVDAGQVQTITWQRGRGNIVIVSHDDGYYTVYTHMADIRVNVNDYVEVGDVIGTVGDSGSLSGPIVHFQIWKNTENLNPEDWLS